MSTVLVLVLVVTFAFAVGRLVTKKLSRYVSLSGVEYLLVGVLIGPLMPWKVLTYQTLDGLEPFVQLLIGLLGFLMGMEGRHAFKKPDAAALGFGSGILVALSVGGVMLLLLSVFGSHLSASSDFRLNLVLLEELGYRIRVVVPSAHLWAAVVIGSAAACCSSYAIANTRSLFNSQGEVGDALESAARGSQLASVVFLGGALAGARATEVAHFQLTVTEWEVSAVALGTFSGLLFALFLGKESDEFRIFLASVSLVTFASGIGALAGVSPLFVNLFAGLTVSFSSQHSTILHEHLIKLMHPLFVLLMLFAGALFVPAPLTLWLSLPVFIVARLGARRLAIKSLARILVGKPPKTRLLSSGMWASGTLAVAIAISGSYRFPELTPLITSTVLGGALICELFSHRALRRLLDDADELPVPKVELPIKSVVVAQ